MPSTPLFAPQEFFSQRSASLGGAVVILILTGVVAVASAVPFLDQFSQIEFTPGLIAFSVIVGGLIGAAGIWTVSTVAVYVLSALAGGSGSLARVAANVGWALLPLLLVNTITTIASWLLALFGGFSPMNPAQLQLPLWLRLANGGIGVIGYLWIGYLLTYAIQDARRLTVRRSAVIAGIIVLPLFLNTLSTLL